MIRNATSEDSESICDIYNYFVENSIATFEEDPVTPESMAERINRTRQNYPWLVCERENTIVGYAYATRWKDRSAYRFSVETTAYVSPASLGCGIGTSLYTELFSRLRKRNIHAINAGISLPNAASVRLHEKMGLAKVAHFKEVGWKLNQWIDVGYWQLLIDENPVED